MKSRFSEQAISVCISFTHLHPISASIEKLSMATILYRLGYISWLTTLTTVSFRVKLNYLKDNGKCLETKPEAKLSQCYCSDEISLLASVLW